MNTSKAENSLLVTEIQRFCMHDGPGVRTVVFLKGCPLGCKWCHNPETQSAKPQLMFAVQKCILCGACQAVCKRKAQKVSPVREIDRSLCTVCGDCAAVCPTQALSIVGKRMTVEDIIGQVKRDAAFYGLDGGLTVSGGEPTLRADALTELLSAAGREGFSVCLETCGVFSPSLLPRILPHVDLFLFDVKDTDPKRLRENTGADAKQIEENLARIDRSGKKTVLRCLMIPEVNMTDSHMSALAELYGRLKHCEYVELLPYHPFGTSKAEQIGRINTAVYQVPTREQMSDFARRLAARNVPVKCMGITVSRLFDDRRP